MVMRRIGFALCWFLIIPLWSVTELHADTIDYVLTLQVTSVDQSSDCVGVGTFGCNNMIGDIHVGRFTVDSSLLSQTGDNLPGTISKFFLEISPVVWDQTQPFSIPSNFFVGFRGPDPARGCPSDCLFAPSPGFNVHGGQ